MAVNDSQARSGNWAGAEGPASSRWVTSATWRNKQCNNVYFLDNGTTNFDNANGSIKTTPSPYSATNSSRPSAVPAFNAGSQFMRFLDANNDGNVDSPNTPYNQQGTTATRDSNPGTTDCSNCQSRGIIPMTSVKATIRDLISAIASSDPDGTTNIVQGLYWGWEVLMPGAPFDEGVATVPFKRTRAIILLTDGEQHGGPGDAYKGRFGFGDGAGENDDSDHGTIQLIDGTSVQNNLDNRLRRLAQNVKNEGIKLYVIGFDLADNPEALDLLDEIASDPDENGEYFFNAPDPEDLESVFAQIAASLSTLRVSM
jgi:hypothetical protein